MAFEFKYSPSGHYDSAALSQAIMTNRLKRDEVARQEQTQQEIGKRLSQFIDPNTGEMDMQRAAGALAQFGDQGYHTLAALSQFQKSMNDGTNKPLRAPTPFEYESASRGVRTGHPVTDALMSTPEGRIHAGNILRGGSSSTYVQGRDDDGNPTYIPMPSRPNAGGASPAPGVRPKYEQLPEQAIKGLTDHAANFAAASKAKDSFKDEFGGLGYGSDTLSDASLTLGSKFPDSFGGATKDAVEWWKNYRFHDQTFRHGVIGSAMTPQDMSMYDKTSITPGMDPSVIKDNLDTRYKLEQAVSSRFAKTHAAGNYNPAQIRASLGEHADTLLGSQPNTKADPLVVDNYRFPNAAAAQAYRKAKGK